jgi:hypothetical protein
MPDDIASIKNKYNVNDYAATMLLEASIQTGMPLHILHSIYNIASKNGTEPVTNGRFFDAVRTYNVTKISTSKRVGTKDDFRTNMIKRSPYSGEIYVMRDKSGNPIRDINGEIMISTGGTIPLNEKGKRLDNKMRNVSTRKMLSETIDDEKEYKEHRPSSTPVPPKYYYIHIDRPTGKLKFDLMGHDLPPSYDKSFLGRGDKIVPYIRVTEIRTVNPSRYPKPIISSSGQIVGHAKTPGFKLLAFDSFFQDRSQHSEVKIPYEGNVGFDSRAGRDLIIGKVRELLNLLMTPKVEALYKELYEVMKEQDMGKDKKLYTSRIAGLDDFTKKRESEDMFRQFYGEDFKEERKRKSIKPSSKRKIVKKIVKKPIKKVKKCSCSNSQKRRIIAIKKKITKRRRK